MEQNLTQVTIPETDREREEFLHAHPNFSLARAKRRLRNRPSDAALTRVWKRQSKSSRIERVIVAEMVRVMSREEAA